ncbi:superoxide dismutase family protein [Kitasatospora sp. NPDC092948]|uniref:superoxide dismutase family protein n=1 Tax=Kitasatospora sp. NPDC092948 TaxID=3364088 RepID=UPI0038223373
MPLPSVSGALLMPLALLPVGPPAVAGPAGTPLGAVPDQVVDARFDRADGIVPARAITHEPDLVPYGAQVRVTVHREAGRTTVAVELAGVAGSHEFPTHVHTGHCSADPTTSGPHYQHTAGSDAADNELRMTVRTDPGGRGDASATVPWTFRPDGAHSLVLHAGPDAGSHAPTDRVGCVDVDF